MLPPARPSFRARASAWRNPAVLERRLNLLQSVSVNMSMMVGIGPFITIPTLVGTLGGPQSMIGWILGAAVALADGMVWSELAAAFPGSGGTYHFYDAIFGKARLGRLLMFVFVWQFLFSGPLEIATGAIGTANYLGYFYPTLAETAWNWNALFPRLNVPVTWGQGAAMGIMAAVTVLAYRRIAVAGRLMVVLWAGMLITVAWVILTGLAHFNPARAFDFPAGPWHLDDRTAMGLGMALSIAMYDFLGYYQICYLGDEVADPSRTIPRAIMISVITIALVYLIMNIGILGVLPWRAVVDSKHVASDLMLRVHGRWAAGLVTVMIVWTALASIFAALLGYSRIPYASARAGHFFSGFARTHATGHFPHRSLLLISAVATVSCLADLATVIAALLASRIVIQFVGQIATVIYLRARSSEPWPTYRMPLYPLPALLALAGWLFAFFTTERLAFLYGVASLVVGVAAFFLWDRAAATRRIAEYTGVSPAPVEHRSSGSSPTDSFPS
jgi:amino acid transporter